MAMALPPAPRASFRHASFLAETQVVACSAWLLYSASALGPASAPCSAAVASGALSARWVAVLERSRLRVADLRKRLSVPAHCRLYRASARQQPRSPQHSRHPTRSGAL